VIYMSVPGTASTDGTWGVIGIGMGYGDAAAVEAAPPSWRSRGTRSGSAAWNRRQFAANPQVPIVVIVLHNVGNLRGDGIKRRVHGPSRHPDAKRPPRRLIEALGG